MRGHKPRADPTGVGRGVLPQLSGPGPQGCSRNRQLVSGAALADLAPGLAAGSILRPDVSIFSSWSFF